MHFFQAVGFPFRGANVWVNIGCALLCFLIPIVGPIVLLGFIIRVELVLLQNIHADAPRFDFGKFSQYLTRGVQVFLANLLLSLGCVLPLMILVAACIIPGVFLLPNHFAGAIACFVGAGLVYLLGLVLLGLLIAPLSFKAGMEDRFAAAFDLRFGLDYLRRVGFTALWTNLLLLVFLLPFILVAFIPCLGIFVGYAVGAVSILIGAHLQMQLYLLYLERGGMVINVKQELPDAAFPVLLAPPPLPPPSQFP